MKDQPATDELLVSPTSAVTDLKGLEDVRLSTAPPAAQSTKNRQRKWKSERRRKTRPPDSEQLAGTPAEKLVDVFVHVDVTMTEPTKQQRLMDVPPAVTTASPPAVAPTVERNGSKETAVRETARNSSTGRCAEEVPSTGAAPTVPPVTERLLLPPQSIRAAAIRRPFSTVKAPGWKEKRVRKRRRKTPHLSPSQNPPLPWNGSENVLQIPDGRFAPKPSASATEQRGETQRGRGTMAAVTVVTRRYRQNGRKQTKPAENAGSLRAGTSDATQTQPATSTATPFAAAAGGGLQSEKPLADPTFSPIYWTIQRAREQFARKKKRKAAMLKRQR